MNRPSTMSAEQIGEALAREFVQAQWLRIQLGLAPGTAVSDMNLWCPQQRVRFRFPPWWSNCNAMVDDDQKLHAIYSGFTSHLHAVAHCSDDPELNASLEAALSHVKATSHTLKSV